MCEGRIAYLKDYAERHNYNETMKLSFDMIFSILSHCYMTDEAKVEAIREVVDTSIELQYTNKKPPRMTHSRAENKKY